MTLVAGVDSSTQSVKIVVCDLETGSIVRTARAAHPDATEVSGIRLAQRLSRSCQ
jgi:xylulokinase